MKKILKYLKPYWFLALLAPIFMGVEVFFELLQPKLMEKIVDNGVLSTTLNLSEKIDVVLNTGLLMLLCVAIAGIGGILSAAFASGDCSLETNLRANPLEEEPNHICPRERE